jgi:molecular chaperone DnaK
METDINLPFITADQSGPKHLNMKLTRAKLEALVRRPDRSARAACVTALKDAGLSASRIDEVILVGGMTRMPAVQSAGEEDLRQGAEQERQPGRGRRDRRRDSGRRAEGRGEGRPAARRDAAVARHRDPGRRVHQADREEHHDPDQEEPDVLDRGRQSAGGDIRVFQGEREMAANNKLLGQFDLVGIPPAPRGMPQVDVSFDIDANGIVHVSAKDLGTGKEQSIRITASSGFSESEIKQMVKDAEVHADEDRQRREAVEARNQLDSLIYQTEKNLNEHGAEVDASTKSGIEEALNECQSGAR